MSKKNFVSLLLGTVGGILFALGMCMAMIPEWNAFQPGIVVGCIGAAVLAVMLMIRRKMGGRPVLVKPSGKAIGTVVLGATGALVLGIGMCMVMVWSMMVQGILVGLVGILLLLCLIPLVKGIQWGQRWERAACSQGYLSKGPGTGYEQVGQIVAVPPFSGGILHRTGMYTARKRAGLIFQKQFSNRVQTKLEYATIIKAFCVDRGKEGQMERWKQFFHALLFPRLAVVLISVPVTAALLLYTFAYGSETSPVTYLAYLFSAYSLLIVCISTGKMAKGGAWQRLHRNPYIHRYLTDLPFQTHVSLYLSLGINLLFAGIKLFLGVYYRSVWFGTLAVYYGMMAMIRFVLLRHVSRAGIGQDIRAEFKYYWLCGVILLLMNSALAGVVVLVVRKDQGFYYAGYLIYVVALYAFYNTITAVRDVVRYRKYQSPVLSAAKAVKLAAALVSMLALETAMLMQFDNGQNAPRFKQIMTAATGGGVCAIVFAMAVFMIVQSTKRLRKWGQERTEYTVDGGN